MPKTRELRKRKQSEEKVTVRFVDDEFVYHCARTRIRCNDEKLQLGALYDVIFKDGKTYKAKLLDCATNGNDSISKSEGEETFPTGENHFQYGMTRSDLSPKNKGSEECLVSSNELFHLETRHCDQDSIQGSQTVSNEYVTGVEAFPSRKTCPTSAFINNSPIQTNRMVYYDPGSGAVEKCQGMGKNSTSSTSVSNFSTNEKLFTADNSSSNSDSETDVASLTNSEKLYAPTFSDMQDSTDESDSNSVVISINGDCEETSIQLVNSKEKLLNAATCQSAESNISDLIQDSEIIPNGSITYAEVAKSKEMLQNSASSTSKEIQVNKAVSNESAVDMVDMQQNALCESTCAITRAVHRSSKKEDGRRVYDKVHYCMYCKKPQKKISRHVKRKHPDEDWVKEAFKEASGSQGRKIKLEQIRNRGDWLHNDEVLTTGKGVFITWKSPSVEVDRSLYLSCEICGGAFIESILWKHRRGCRLKTGEGPERKGRRVKSAAAMLTGVPSGAGQGLQENVLLHMNYDRVTLAVKGDKLIIAFGEQLYHKLGHDKSQHQYIAQKLRELGRLLIALRDVNKNIKCLEDAINPSEFKTTITAVRAVTGYKPDTATYKVPSLALKLGHSLNKCAALVKYVGLTTSNNTLVTRADQFSSLMTSNWNSEVSAHALTTLNTRQWNKPLLLPTTEDIIKFNKFLKEKEAECKSVLQTKPNTRTWYELSKVVLAQIILFNRRRSGETSKVLLSTYELNVGKEPERPHDDILKSLTQLERRLLDSFFRFEVRGKKGRKVAILLTKDLKCTLDLLVDLRSVAGVDVNNIYLFAKPYYNSEAHIRGHDCLKELSTGCGLKNPQAITSTMLRKHVATVSQILNLKDNELDMLANFLGHDIQVHREYYRLPESTLQVAKIAKILMNMHKGHMHECSGKSLDEMKVTDEDVILSDSSEGSSEESDSNEVSCGLPKTNRRNNCKAKTQKDVQIHGDKLVDNELSTVTNITEQQNTSQNTKKKNSMRIGSSNDPQSKPKTVRRWTPDEIAAVKKHLEKYFILNKIPGKDECEECISKEKSVLKHRKWFHVKHFVRNSLKALEKKNAPKAQKN